MVFSWFQWIFEHHATQKLGGAAFNVCSKVVNEIVDVFRTSADVYPLMIDFRFLQS